MSDLYADVVIDITNEHVDRTFTYLVPETMKDRACPGMPVRVPFGIGDHLKTGCIVHIGTTPPEGNPRLKMIAGEAESAFEAEQTLVQLALWMHEHYGCMLNQALKTVLPVRQKVRVKTKKTIISRCSLEELCAAHERYEKKHQAGKARLLAAVIEGGGVLAYDMLSSLKVPAATVLKLSEEGLLSVCEEEGPFTVSGEWNRKEKKEPVVLNEEQAACADRFRRDLLAGVPVRYLLYGITGSGKTEVYAEMIKEVIAEGKQAILLIPEISLTYQTVERFRQRFGSRVAVIHSKLSQSERYREFNRAAEGEADILIGPRSAVFAPFTRLGLIIIDEEHDGAYKSDTVPAYDTRVVAEKRAELSNAALVLGSATPSAASFRKTKDGTYSLLRLTKRAVSGALPAETTVVDLRQEMREGNRSVFSRALRGKIEERLRKGEQTILFMNRRGYSNFVSCRSCGEAIRCPHCDVALTLHTGDRLVCHYCGYTTVMPKKCPLCTSPYIAGFGTGTQKLEQLTKEAFPGARVLRLDADAASKKEAGSRILSEFRDGKADILIGTQMVVKGHDFPNVTLVGIMAADTELYVSSYDSAERTFQLLAQAAGRAGRGGSRGEVIIQTYRPDHYAVRTAAAQDFEAFYQNEIAFREAGCYPPAVHLLTLKLSSEDEQLLIRGAECFALLLEKAAEKYGAELFGPVNAGVYKLKDRFRKMIYMKHSSYDILICIKNAAEENFRTAFPQGPSALADLV